MPLNTRPIAKPPKIIRVIEVRNQNLQRTFRFTLRHRNCSNDLLEQRLQIRSRNRRISCSRPKLAVGIQNRKVQNRLIGIKVDEQVIDLIQHLLRTRIRPVDLVDHDHRSQSRFKRLRQHIASLRQRPFRGIDQQHYAIDHLQRTLHLTTKVSVTWRINDIDLVVVIVEGRILGQNRNAALLFQVVRVHHPLGDGLVGAEGATLAQHSVHKSGLAMVDVGDDGDVENGFHCDCG